jgi:O-antigen/teichoic acid export membrane protein
MMPHGELWGYIAGAVIGAVVLLIALIRRRRRVLKSLPTPHQYDQIIDERLQAMKAEFLRITKKDPAP